MNKIIIPLSQAVDEDRELIGNKAASLAKIMAQGMRVPDGFCVTRIAYEIFLRKTGIDKRILVELGRKKFEDMRWEELWDAALRIRNMFTVTKMPQDIKKNILEATKDFFSGQPIAIRSSSLAEDSQGASFAGLHESFINISDPGKIIKYIQLVWASLWSDAALLYRNELNLDVQTSAMTVILQRMISGEKSGVGFCIDPNNDKQAVIESVYGLNKGLVDGDIEPDRYFIDRKTSKIISSSGAAHYRKVKPAANGVEMIDCESINELSLSDKQVNDVYISMKRLEKLFCGPQDVEWTIKDKKLYILQSRPITLQKKGEKGWYLSLHRSLDNLQQLAKRIEFEIIPAMHNEAREMALLDLDRLSDDELALEVERRKRVNDKWHDVYWNECIPFAHGVRLFATVYNDVMHPEDPYEFIDIILPEKMKSVERNTRMQEASRYIMNNPSSIDKKGNIRDDYLQKEIGQISQDLSIIPGVPDISVENNNLIISLLQQMSKKDNLSFALNKTGRVKKTEAFINAFSEKDKLYAQELIRIAKKSYQLRDDDNIYFAQVEAMLTRSLIEAKKRLGARCESEKACMNPEEIITALKFPDYVIELKHDSKIKEAREILNARQLTGQPAGKGIARGTARVIRSSQDLFAVKKDEIIVCDAIDPTMTFCIPLVSAIVERRGGMLIHGAIIAREYGIPCVTGIPQATEFIQTGDQITVDGYYGLVINHTRTFEGIA